MRLFFSPSIDEREWHIWVPKVKLGELHNKFFFYVDLDDADERVLIDPPRGLYGKEFLELDYGDPFALMEFQQRWGPITGLRTRPNTTFDRGTYVDLDCLGGIRSTSTPAGFMNTIYLYEGHGDIDVIARERYGVRPDRLRDIVDDNWRSSLYGKERKGPVPCHVATIREVAEAVCHAQIAITAITDCLKDDFTEEDWQARGDLVRQAIRYCNSSIQGTILPLDLIEDGDRTGVCTLMQSLFINMARGVMRNNAYRKCQNLDCQRLFTPEEYGRRADSRYCSPDCQVKAKHQRTYKPKRIAEKKAQTESERIDEVHLSWSNSDAPVRTLKRYETLGDDIHGIAAAYSFLGFGDCRVEDEFLIEMHGLNIPNLSAQRALKGETFDEDALKNSTGKEDDR